ncbi:MAG: hypothetical protein MUP17_05030 [candidate division Zixibacteria bacterium]|nr:hypothetical protein [candidate division Zixibacteria bacterium]
MPEQPQTPGQPTFGFERNLAPMIYTKDQEKTFIDKVLDRKDSERLAELMKKEELDRTELLELLYLIVSINTKLVNYSDWDRYLLGKFLAWIRDFCTLHESLLDYIKQFEDEKDPKATKEEIKNKEDVMKTLTTIRKYDSHNLKFLIDIYLYLSNSTLSIGGTAFDTLSKNRYEYAYPNAGYNPAAPPQKKGVFDWLKKGD